MHDSRSTKGKRFCRIFPWKPLPAREGVEQNDKQAFSLFLMAASDKISPNAYAMYQLGGMYQNGIGTEQDLKESERWYQCAYQGFLSLEEKSRDGYHIVIIGNREHPEVMGIEGWAQGPATIIQTEEEARAFELVPESEKVCVVAQTTFNYNKFKDLVEIISEKRYDIIVLNTICNATKERQEEAYDIAKRVDAMIVIGDKRSSNTQKLFEICSNACADTYYIQTLGDLNMNQLRSVETVGITAGASTPNKIIEEVQNNVRINF